MSRVFSLDEVKRAARCYLPHEVFRVGQGWVSNGFILARCNARMERRETWSKLDEGTAVSRVYETLTRHRVPLKYIGGRVYEHNGRPDIIEAIYECRRGIITLLNEGYAELLDGLKVVRLGLEPMDPVGGVDADGNVAVVIMPRLP